MYNNLEFKEQEKLLDDLYDATEKAKGLILEIIADLIKESGGIGAIDPKLGMLLIKGNNILAEFGKVSERSYKASRESIENQKIIDQKLNIIIEKISSKKERNDNYEKTNKEN